MADKAELLANLEAYATEYGCNDAMPKNPVPTYLKAYDGQAHHMAKAAHSLVIMLSNLDYSSFHEGHAATLTRDIHALINRLEFRGPSYPVRRGDGEVVQVTVPEREEYSTNFDNHEI